jgi:iron-sulfur cluster insertion protein
MSVVQSQAPTIMSLTDSAAAKVQSLITEEGNPQLKLRVFVTGGGCSGFQYGFSFDEEVADDDTLIENLEGLEGSRFVVNNPLATTTCGCGSSFSI